MTCRRPAAQAMAKGDVPKIPIIVQTSSSGTLNALHVVLPCASPNVWSRLENINPGRSGCPYSLYCWFEKVEVFGGFRF